MSGKSKPSNMASFKVKWVLVRRKMWKNMHETFAWKLLVRRLNYFIWISGGAINRIEVDNMAWKRANKLCFVCVLTNAT